MKINTRSRNIENIVVLIVFCTFAFSVLMVLMLGAGVYRNISDITHESENERTAISYIRTKIRNLDSAGAFYAGDFNGVSALYINEQLGDTVYQTVIYAYDGNLCEIFSNDVSGFQLSDGMRVAAVDDLQFTLRDNSVIEISSGGISGYIMPGSTGSIITSIGDRVS